MRSVKGQITARLTKQLAPTDPAWTPDRSATTPPVTRKPSEGWSVSGRKAKPAA